MAGMINAGIVGAALGKWQTISETLRTVTGAWILSRLATNQRALDAAARFGSAAPGTGRSYAALQVIWSSLGQEDQNDLRNGLSNGPMGGVLSASQMRIVDESQGRLRGQQPVLEGPFQ
jgi:hypothetical protein